MAKRNQSSPKSFEEALKELEQIVTEIETGEVALEESLLKYQRGNFLIQHCRRVLDSAEKQIETLSRSGEDESPAPADLAEESEADLPEG